jgi:hypothetical protein
VLADAGGLIDFMSAGRSTQRKIWNTGV